MVNQMRATAREIAAQRVAAIVYDRRRRESIARPAVVARRINPNAGEPTVSDYMIVVDPGYETGVAVFHRHVLLGSITTTPPHERLEEILIRYAKHDPLVVVEQGPVIRHNAETCAEVEALVRRLATNIQWVRPTQWKRHPAARLLGGDHSATIHERDAISLGRWVLNTARRNDDHDHSAQAAVNAA